MRTYEEAIDIMINFWVEKSFKTLFNQDNGDRTAGGRITHLLMNTVASKAKEGVTEEKIEKFKQVLKNLLLLADRGYSSFSCLSVDYHPNEMLFTACEQSGISTSCLPCKTFTQITTDNFVEGRYQYGGDWFKL